VIREVERYLRNEVSLKRYLHTLRVTKTTVMLCERFDLSPAEGWTAGMAHDIAREWEAHALLENAGRDGYGLSDQERQVPLLVHGRAAAVYLQERYGERRESVLQAIRWHTTGHVRMGALGMALYCADYMEPGRSHISEEQYRSLMSYDNLQEMTLAILETELERMRAMDRAIAPQSLELQQRLREELLRGTSGEEELHHVSEWSGAT
jgi:nicotinate-nucleotide adenylyltransferase